MDTISRTIQGEPRKTNHEDNEINDFSFICREESVEIKVVPAISPKKVADPKTVPDNHCLVTDLSLRTISERSESDTDESNKYSGDEVVKTLMEKIETYPSTSRQGGVSKKLDTAVDDNIAYASTSKHGRDTSTKENSSYPKQKNKAENGFNVVIVPINSHDFFDCTCKVAASPREKNVIQEAQVLPTNNLCVQKLTPINIERKLVKQNVLQLQIQNKDEDVACRSKNIRYVECKYSGMKSEVGLNLDSETNTKNKAYRMERLLVEDNLNTVVIMDSKDIVDDLYHANRNVACQCSDTKECSEGQNDFLQDNTKKSQLTTEKYNPSREDRVLANLLVVEPLKEHESITCSFKEDQKLQLVMFKEEQVEGCVIRNSPKSHEMTPRKFQTVLDGSTSRKLQTQLDGSTSKQIQGNEEFRMPTAPTREDFQSPRQQYLIVSNSQIESISKEEVDAFRKKQKHNKSLVGAKQFGEIRKENKSTSSMEDFEVPEKFRSKPNLLRDKPRACIEAASDAKSVGKDDLLNRITKISHCFQMGVGSPKHLDVMENQRVKCLACGKANSCRCQYGKMKAIPEIEISSKSLLDLSISSDDVESRDEKNSNLDKHLDVSSSNDEEESFTANKKVDAKNYITTLTSEKMEIISKYSKAAAKKFQDSPTFWYEQPCSKLVAGGCVPEENNRIDEYNVMCVEDYTRNNTSSRKKLSSNVEENKADEKSMIHQNDDNLQILGGFNTQSLTETPVQHLGAEQVDVVFITNSDPLTSESVLAHDMSTVRMETNLNVLSIIPDADTPVNSESKLIVDDNEIRNSIDYLQYAENVVLKAGNTVPEPYNTSRMILSDSQRRNRPTMNDKSKSSVNVIYEWQTLNSPNIHLGAGKSGRADHGNRSISKTPHYKQSFTGGKLRLFEESVINGQFHKGPDVPKEMRRSYLNAFETSQPAYLLDVNAGYEVDPSPVQKYSTNKTNFATSSKADLSNIITQGVSKSTPTHERIKTSAQLRNTSNNGVIRREIPVANGKINSNSNLMKESSEPQLSTSSIISGDVLRATDSKDHETSALDHSHGYTESQITINLLQGLPNFNRNTSSFPRKPTQGSPISVYEGGRPRESTWNYHEITGGGQNDNSSIFGKLVIDKDASFKFNPSFASGNLALDDYIQVRDTSVQVSLDSPFDENPDESGACFCNANEEQAETGLEYKLRRLKCSEKQVKSCAKAEENCCSALPNSAHLGENKFVEPLYRNALRCPETQRHFFYSEESRPRNLCVPLKLSKDKNQPLVTSSLEGKYSDPISPTLEAMLNHQHNSPLGDRLETDKYPRRNWIPQRRDEPDSDSSYTEPLVRTEDSVSEGEVRCKCSVSSGELHHCETQEMLKCIYNRKRNAPEGIKVVRKHLHNKNFVSYYYSRKPCTADKK